MLSELRATHLCVGVICWACWAVVVDAALPLETLTQSEGLGPHLPFKQETSAFGKSTDKTCPATVVYYTSRSNISTAGTVETSAAAFETPGGPCEGDEITIAKPRSKSELSVWLLSALSHSSVFDNVLHGKIKTATGNGMACVPSALRASKTKEVPPDRFNSVTFARPASTVQLAYLTLAPDKLYLFLGSPSNRQREINEKTVVKSGYPCVYSVDAPESSEVTVTGATAPASTTAPASKDADPKVDSGSASTDNRQDTTSSGGTQIGKVIGAAVGSLILIAILVFAFVYWQRRKASPLQNLEMYFE